MTKDNFIENLLSSGWKKDRSNHGYYFKRSESKFNCLTNERSPNIGIKIFEAIHNNTTHQSFSINIRAESNLGKWVDTGFYSISFEEDFNLDELVLKTISSWEALNR